MTIQSNSKVAQEIAVAKAAAQPVKPLSFLDKMAAKAADLGRSASSGSSVMTLEKRSEIYYAFNHLGMHAQEIIDELPVNPDTGKAYCRSRISEICTSGKDFWGRKNADALIATFALECSKIYAARGAKWTGLPARYGKVQE